MLPGLCWAATPKDEPLWARKGWVHNRLGQETGEAVGLQC